MTTTNNSDTPMSTTTATLNVQGIGPVSLTVTECGSGHPFLLLHPGAGSQTVARFAEVLSNAEHAHVITPIYPGFDGTPRPDGLTSMAGIAAVFAAYLQQRRLQDVTIIGNSIGGWIAAELALLHPPEVNSLVLVDAVGLEVPGHPVTDIRPLTPEELSRLSFYDPARFRVNPAALSEEQRAGMAANRAVLYLYGGETMTDPGLGDRLARIGVPTLLIWGAADQIVDLAYGRAYADAISDSQLSILPDAGHLPPIETPETLARMVWQFADAQVAGRRRP